MSYFWDDNDYTQEGTKEILNYFFNRFIFQDLQDDKEFQEKDIDFRFINNQNKDDIRLVEIKCDSYISGNIFIETISNNSKGTLGCILKTESDYLFYYFRRWGRLYIFKTEPLKQWTLKNEDKNRFKISHPVTHNRYENTLYYGTGMVVPLDTLINELPDESYSIVEMKNESVKEEKRI